MADRGVWLKRFVSTAWEGLLEPDRDVELPKDVAHHIRHVMRLSRGATVALCDGNGTEAVATLTELDLATVNTTTFSPRVVGFTMFVSLIKQDRWSWMLEKLTEVGASAIYPVTAERSAQRVKDVAKSNSRWRRICENAARQCGRAYVPKIAAPLTVTEGIGLPYDHFFGSLDGPPAPFTFPIDAPAIWIGPEGGFSDDEFDALRSVATPWCFSSNVLRAETAALIAAAFVDVRLNSIA